MNPRSSIQRKQYVALGVIDPISIGTGLLSIGGSLFGKDKEKEAQNAAWRERARSLFDEYLPMMGKVPGRALGVSNIELIWEGAVQTGAWGAGKDTWVKDANRLHADSIANVIPSMLSQTDDPRKLVDLWAAYVEQRAKDPWAVPRNPTARQIAIDAIDAIVARHKPNAPLYYGRPAAPVQSAASTSVPGTALAQPTAQDAMSSDIASLVRAALASGQSEQQAFTSVLQALGQRGVAPAAPVQNAVANEVQRATSQVNPWLIGGGLALAGVLVFALAGRR